MKKLMQLLFCGLFGIISVYGDNAGAGLGPDVKVNYSDGPVYVNQGNNVIVSVQMTPGGFAGVNADWWCAACSGSQWFYLNSSLQWVYCGLNLNSIRPVYRGALFDLAPFAVLSASDLSPGNYTVYFGIDTTADGCLSMDTVWMDAASLTVQSTVNFNGRWQGISSTGQVESTLDLNTVGESVWGYLYWPNNDTRYVHGAINGWQLTLSVKGGDVWYLTLANGELTGTAQKWGGGTYDLHFWR